MSDASASLAGPPPAPPAPPAPLAPAAPIGVALPDFLNPILVRETVQSLNGKAFTALFFLSLIGAAFTAFFTLENGAHEDFPRGTAAFHGLLQFVFLPVVLIYIPFQSFGSMRSELQGGTAELLLLSNLTPGRIVRGRVLATMTQFLLWLSLLAPLIALTYLLRGVSISDILLAVAMSAVFSLVAAAFMTALGAFTRFKAAAALANALAGIGLAIASVVVIVEFPDILRELRSSMTATHGPAMVSMVLLMLAAGTLLLLLVAQSQLTHPNENRSTPFRLFYAGSVLAAFAWIKTVASLGLPASAVHVVCMGGLFYGIPFLLFPATEDERFSPRMRTLVPRNPFLAILSAPFLPGRGRGFLFLLICTGALLAVNEASAPSYLAPHGGLHTFFSREFIVIPRLAALYIVIYGGLGSLVRSLLRKGVLGNWVARIAVLLMIAVFSLVPALLEVFFLDRRRLEWSGIHVLNPFFTIDEFAADATRPMPYLIAFAVVTILLNLPVLLRSLSETLAASKARRSAAA